MGLAQTELLIPEIIAYGGDEFRTDRLLTYEQITGRVDEMGAELAEHYAGLGSVHVLTVLTGAAHYASRLQFAMQAARPRLDIISDEVKVASYGAGTESSGIIRSLLSPTLPLAGEHVLIVEDVLDTGLTLRWLNQNFRDKEHRPASVEIAAAFQKMVPDKVSKVLGEVAVHTGFYVGDQFLVGYGLDIGQRYRHLRDLYALTKINTQ